MIPRDKYKRMMRLFVETPPVHEYIKGHFVSEFLSFETTKRDKENNKTGMVIVAREEKIWIFSYRIPRALYARILKTGAIIKEICLAVFRERKKK